VLALGLVANLLLAENLRALLLACIGAIVEGAVAGVTLSFEDPATAMSVVGALARVAILVAPLARLLSRSQRRRRWVWVPLLLTLGTLLFGVSQPGLSGLLMWTLGILAAALGWWAAGQDRRWMHLLVFTPWVVAAEPMLGHSPLSDRVWSTERLATRCETNDGSRPANLKPELLRSRYFGATALDDARLLIHGEAHSMWAWRTGDRAATLELAPELPRLRGNFWEGCARDGHVWLSHNGRVCRVDPPVERGDAGDQTCWELPRPAGTGVELDFVDPVCDQNTNAIYVSQLVRGGMVRFDPETEAVQFVPVLDGLNLQLARWGDAMLGVTTSTLAKFELESGEVAWTRPVGLVAMGLSVCQADGATAVTDFTGRVRIFEHEPDSAGPPALTGARFLPAPRRVEFSPDCTQLAVSSGNDAEVFVLRRSDLETVRSYRLGPGIRDLTWLDDETLAVADACSLTTLHPRD
jgi:hypothetical protein